MSVAFLRRLHHSEGGQGFILMVLAMTLVFLIGVLVVDFGFWFAGRASVVNATDQAAMSGSLKLPQDGAGAAADAFHYLQLNDPEVAPADVTIEFRCIVGDRNHNGAPDTGDIPAICPQLAPSDFTCVDGLCYALCEFNAPNAKCNTIVAKGSKDVPFGFAEQFGITSANAAGFTSAACRGSCGSAPTLPLDIVMIIDRSTSMSTSELDNAKNGARAVLELFDPNVQHVALGVLPLSRPTNDCVSVNQNSDPGNWIVTDLLGDYQNSDGTLNNSSEIVSDINCLQRASMSQPSASAHTNLGDPLQAAADYLLNNGREGVKKGIILLTDGSANQPTGPIITSSTGFKECTAQAAVTSGAGDNNGYESFPGNLCADGASAGMDVNSGNGTQTSCTSAQKDKHVFSNFGLDGAGGVPAGATIDTIEVRLDAWASLGATTRSLCVDLSWNGGATWTNAQPQALIGTTERIYLFGGTNWGRTWSLANLSNGSFRVRVTDIDNNNSTTFSLDTVQVNVEYHYPDPSYAGPCDYAADKANAARAAGIELFTIGYGVEGSNCEDENINSAFEDETTTRLLAYMANGDIQYDDGGDGFGGQPAGCATPASIAGENTDGDHFLCEAKTSDLVPVFKIAAEALAGGSRLVKIPF